MNTENHEVPYEAQEPTAEDFELAPDVLDEIRDQGRVLRQMIRRELHAERQSLAEVHEPAQ